MVIPQGLWLRWRSIDPAKLWQATWGIQSLFSSCPLTFSQCPLLATSKRQVTQEQEEKGVRGSDQWPILLPTLIIRYLCFYNELIFGVSAILFFLGLTVLLSCKYHRKQNAKWLHLTIQPSWKFVEKMWAKSLQKLEYFRENSHVSSSKHNCKPCDSPIFVMKLKQFSAVPLFPVIKKIICKP